MSKFPDGFKITFGGQEYRPASVRSHTKADGTVIEVVDWDTECASCRAPVRLFTTLNFKEPRRRCDGCKAPGVSVHRQFGRQSRRKILNAVTKQATARGAKLIVVDPFNAL